MVLLTHCDHVNQICLQVQLMTLTLIKTCFCILSSCKTDHEAWCLLKCWLDTKIKIVHLCWYKQPVKTGIINCSSRLFSQFMTVCLWHIHIFQPWLSLPLNDAMLSILPSKCTYVLGGYPVFMTLGRYTLWKVCSAFALALYHLSPSSSISFNSTYSLIIWASNLVNIATKGTVAFSNLILCLVVYIPSPNPLVKNLSSSDWIGRDPSIGMQYLHMVVKLSSP